MKAGFGWILIAATLLGGFPSLLAELTHDELLLAQSARASDLAGLFGLSPDLDPLEAVALEAIDALAGELGWAWRALALTLHLLSTWLVFRLVSALFEAPRASFLAALLFGLHPLHVENLVRLEGLDGPLAAVFALGALLAHFRGRTTWVLVLALLAHLANEHTLILVGLAWLVGRAAGLAPRSVRGLWPFLAAALTFLALRALATGSWQAGFERVPLHHGVDSVRMAWLRLELGGGWLGALVWPFAAGQTRPFLPELASFDLATWQPLLWIFVWAALCVFLLRRTEQRAAWLLLAAPVALLPLVLRPGMLGVFPFADRFAYLAVFGFAAGGLLLVDRILPRAALWIGGSLLAIGCGVLDWQVANRHRDGLTRLTAALERYPDQPTLLSQRGRLLLDNYRRTLDRNQLRDAFNDFDRCLARLEATQSGDATVFATRRDHIESNLGLAWCYWYEAQLDDYGDYQLSLAIFDQVAERYPEEIQGHIGLAVAFMSLGKLDEAEQALSLALELDPDSPEAHHNYGQLHMRRNAWTEAAGEFEAALEARPDHLQDLLWVARAQIEAGQQERAREALTRAREAHPESPAPWAIEASQAASQGRFEEAMEQVRRALELDPDDGEALLLKGKLHARKGENNSARTAWVKACERLPLSFEAHYNTASILLTMGGPQAALPYLMRAYRLASDEDTLDLLEKAFDSVGYVAPGKLCQLGDVDRRRGLPGRARHWAERAFSTEPDFAEAHFLSASILEDAGQLEQATLLWEKTVASDPRHRAALIRLSVRYASLGETERAIDFLERAITATGSDQRLAPAQRQSAIERLREKLDQLRQG